MCCILLAYMWLRMFYSVFQSAGNLLRYFFSTVPTRYLLITSLIL